jgi:hypothetical protein
MRGLVTNLFEGYEMSIPKAILSTVLIVFCQQSVTVKGKPPDDLGTVERVIAFTVHLETQSSDPKPGRYICVAFGHGLNVDVRAISSELKRRGLRVNSEEWCRQRATGLIIAVLSPIKELSGDMYELSIEVGNLSVPQGEHFATLLKRGTYVVQLEKGSDPELVSYQRTCCSKTG